MLWYVNQIFDRLHSFITMLMKPFAFSQHGQYKNEEANAGIIGQNEIAISPKVHGNHSTVAIGEKPLIHPAFSMVVSNDSQSDSA